MKIIFGYIGIAILMICPILFLIFKVTKSDKNSRDDKDRESLNDKLTRPDWKSTYAISRAPNAPMAAWNAVDNPRGNATYVILSRRSCLKRVIIIKPIFTFL